MSDIKQWVNLPKEDIFVDNEIPNKEKLGKVKIKAKFRNDDLALIKLRLIEDGGDNLMYSEEEVKVGRSKRYKNPEIIFGPQINDNNKEIEFEEEFELPAAGGNKYKFEAVYAGDDEPKLTVKKVEVRRRMYFEVITMDGVNVPSKSNLETKFKNIFEDSATKVAIELKEIGGRSKNLTYQKTWIKGKKDKSLSNDSKISKEISTVFSSKEYLPYVIPVAFVNYIVKYKPLKLTQDVKLGNDEKLLNITTSSDGKSKEIKMELSRRSPRFYGYDDDLDKKHAWFVSASLNIPDTTPVTLEVKDVIQANNYSITFKISDKNTLEALENKKSQLVLRLNVKDGAYNGFARGGKLVVVALQKNEKGKRVGKEPKEYMPTIVHEFGHIFGMAATGDCIFPAQDKKEEVVHFVKRHSPDHNEDNLYGQFHSGFGDKNNANGHQGAHCKKGVKYEKKKDQWSGKPGCVMFGSSGFWVGKKLVKRETTEFCPDCVKALRKSDLKR